MSESRPYHGEMGSLWERVFLPGTLQMDPQEVAWLEAAAAAQGVPLAVAFPIFAEMMHERVLSRFKQLFVLDTTEALLPRDLLGFRAQALEHLDDVFYLASRRQQTERRASTALQLAPNPPSGTLAHPPDLEGHQVAPGQGKRAHTPETPNSNGAKRHCTDSAGTHTDLLAAAWGQRAMEPFVYSPLDGHPKEPSESPPPPPPESPPHFFPDKSGHAEPSIQSHRGTTEQGRRLLAPVVADKQAGREGGGRAPEEARVPLAKPVASGRRDSKEPAHTGAETKAPGKAQPAHVNSNTTHTQHTLKQDTHQHQTGSGVAAFRTSSRTNVEETKVTTAQHRTSDHGDSRRGRDDVGREKKDGGGSSRENRASTPERRETLVVDRQGEKGGDHGRKHGQALRRNEETQRETHGGSRKETSERKELRESVGKGDGSEKPRQEGVRQKDDRLDREKEAKERETRDREAREKESREREAKEKEEREREEREKERREKEEKERRTRERGAKERESKEKEAREREAKEKETREREAKEKETREGEAKEKETREREAKEKEMREREAKEKETREREAKEKEMREREGKEKETREREAKEKREREAKEKETREREAEEKETSEREAKDKEARERGAREKEMNERNAKEAREKQAREKEMKEQEAQEKEWQAKEREREREWERERNRRREREAEKEKGKEREHEKDKGREEDRPGQGGQERDNTGGRREHASGDLRERMLDRRGQRGEEEAGRRVSRPTMQEQVEGADEHSAEGQGRRGSSRDISDRLGRQSPADVLRGGRVDRGDDKQSGNEHRDRREPWPERKNTQQPPQRGGRREEQGMAQQDWRGDDRGRRGDMGGDRGGHRRDDDRRGGRRDWGQGRGGHGRKFGGQQMQTQQQHLGHQQRRDWGGRGGNSGRPDDRFRKSPVGVGEHERGGEREREGPRSGRGSMHATPDPQEAQGVGEPRFLLRLPSRDDPDFDNSWDMDDTSKKRRAGDADFDDGGRFRRFRGDEVDVGSGSPMSWGEDDFS